MKGVNRSKNADYVLYQYSQALYKAGKTKQAVKELENQNLIIVRKKPNYIGISLDSHNKKVIVEFMKSKLPHLKEFIN